MHRFALGLCLGLTAQTALAAPSRVAVLELRNEAGVDAAAARYLTDRVRVAAVQAQGDHFFVMTRENILEQLPPGTDLATCEGACEVETGRNVGADVVISGELVALDGALRLVLKAHDTHSGKLIGAETVGGATPADLEAPASGAARALFARLPAPAPRVVGSAQVAHGVAMVAPAAVINAPVADDAGFLVIDSRPTGARIFIDGEDVGVAPLQREQPVGRYTLEARQPLHHGAKQVLDLTHSGARVLLELPPAHGTLTIDSTPPGAVVRINGERAGETPYTALQKPSGTYAVQVEAPCHRPAKASIAVEDALTAKQHFALEPSCGALRVSSSPPGAAVVLDDRETGQITPAEFRDLQPGVVRLSLRLDGYGTAAAHATIEPRVTGVAEVILEPKYGLLAVMATQKDGAPCEGELRVDGRVVGATPWKGQVLARRADLTVRCPDGVAHGRAQVAHNAKAQALLEVGKGLGGPDHCEIDRARCLEQAGIDDRVYQRCFQEADRCAVGGDGGPVRPTALRRSAAARPKLRPDGSVSYLVQVDRLRDYYVLQGVLWVGDVDAPLRVGLGASALNVHVPAGTPDGFTDIGLSFGGQLLLQARLNRYLGALATAGINGGWVLCDDGPDNSGKTPKEVANSALCRELVGPEDPGSDPNLGFGMVHARFLLAATIRPVEFHAGWAFVAPFGADDHVDFGPSHGVSFGVAYGF